MRQVMKGGELRLHPLVTKLVEPEVLEKLGAGRRGTTKVDRAGSWNGSVQLNERAVKAAKGE